MKEESINRIKNKICEIAFDDNFDPIDKLELLLNFRILLENAETYKESMKVLEEHRKTKMLKLDKIKN